MNDQKAAEVTRPLTFRVAGIFSIIFGTLGIVFTASGMLVVGIVKPPELLPFAASIQFQLTYWFVALVWLVVNVLLVLIGYRFSRLITSRKKTFYSLSLFIPIFYAGSTIITLMLGGSTSHAALVLSTTCGFFAAFSFFWLWGPALVYLATKKGDV